MYLGCQQSLYQHSIFVLELPTSSQINLVRGRQVLITRLGVGVVSERMTACEAVDGLKLR